MSRVAEAEVFAQGFRTRYFEAVPEKAARGTIVLLHDGAFGADAETSWHHLFEPLSEEYRVLAPDLLGYGGTDKVVYLGGSAYGFRTEHVAAFCSELGVTDTGAHFVGVSFGGSMLLRALSPSAPALPIRSATSIGGTGGPWRAATSSQLAEYDGTEADMSRLLALMVDADMPGFSEAVKKRHRNTLIPGHVEACLAARLRGPASQTRPQNAWPEILQDCAVPVMLVEGERDELMEHGWSEHFRGVLVNLRLEKLETMHLPNLDHPELLTELLLDFIHGLDRDGAKRA